MNRVQKIGVLALALTFMVPLVAAAQTRQDPASNPQDVPTAGPRDLSAILDSARQGLDDDNADQSDESSDTDPEASEDSNVAPLTEAVRSSEGVILLDGEPVDLGAQDGSADFEFSETPIPLSLPSTEPATSSTITDADADTVGQIGGASPLPMDERPLGESLSGGFGSRAVPDTRTDATETPFDEVTSAPGNTVVLRALDKVTARTRDIDAAIGAPMTFGSLEITPRYCRKRPPEEPPEVFAYLEVREPGRLDPNNDAFVENDGDESVADVFRGWMFASSPGLNAMEHPVYDVWVIDCKAAAPELR